MQYKSSDKTRTLMLSVAVKNIIMQSMPEKANAIPSISFAK